MANPSTRNAGPAALIVVDVQVGFVRPASAHVVPLIRGLAAMWRRTGDVVAFSRYRNVPDSPFERVMGWTAMQSGHPDVDLVAELQADLQPADIVIDKTTYSAITPSLTEALAAREVTDVYVCGIATEACVLQTAVEAFERGLTPWLIADACASEAGMAAHEAGLVVAGRLIGRRQLIDLAEAEQRLR